MFYIWWHFSWGSRFRFYAATSSNNFVSLHKLYRDKLEYVSLKQLVTCMTTKPRLLVNMLPNIKTCENRWPNFLENLRVVAIKLLELTQFASRNQSIYFYFVRCWGPLWWWVIFRAQSIYWEVYVSTEKILLILTHIISQWKVNT